MSSITVNKTQSSVAKVSGQYLHGAEDLRLESRDILPPAPDEVQIAIRSTTLCGSDVHYFRYFRNGSIQAREPLCLGHESAGQIVALGSNVRHQKPELQVGDSVALEVGVPCEHCSLCQSGRYNICPSLKFRSSGSKFPHYQGTLQELVNHAAKWTHKLPPDLDYETGALLEPLAVAVHAVRRRGNEALNNKSTCLVFGAGAVGLMCAIAARSEGCHHIVMADVDQGRLQFALDNGFASTIHTVSQKQGSTTEKNLEIAKQTADTIASLTWPNGEYIGQVGTTFECTGVESCLQSSIYATISGGSVLIIGMGTPNHTLPISEASHREVNLITSWRYADAYQKAIEISRKAATGSPVNGQIIPCIQNLITHRFIGLNSVPEAFGVAARTRDKGGKLVVKTVINL